MFFTKHQRRNDLSFNASSMADIAFLLLVFFLVTTTIDIEKGLRIKLPALDTPPLKGIVDRNVLSVKLNFNDALMVENNLFSIYDLKTEVKLHIMNPNGDPHRAIQPNSAVISLTNDRNTSYRRYISVYNELKAAYNELWEEQALVKYQLPFNKLTRRQQQELKKEIPLVISEGDVVDMMQ